MDIEVVWALISASQNALKEAKALDASLLNRDLYNRYIKVSLNCFFKIFRNYSSLLDDKIQSILYYRTAQILFNETISFDLAQDYCIRGINICKKNEPLLTLNKLKLQYLHFQIQFNSSTDDTSIKSSLSYLNTIISNEIPNNNINNYNTLENSDNNNNNLYFLISIFFKYVKFKYFNNLYSINKNISDLLKLSSQLQNLNSYHSFHMIILIDLLNLKILNNNSLISINETFIKLKNMTLSSHFNQSSSIQFKAIILLFDLIISLNFESFQTSKNKFQLMDNFIKSLKKNSNLKSWKSLKISYDFKSSNESFQLEFDWLTFNDFVLLSYFNCGILYTFKSWNKKNKSIKLFKLVDSLLENINSIHKENIKSNYLKFLSSFYTILSNIINDNYPKNSSDLLFIKDFIENYRNNKFTNYELIIYNNLLPLINYIFALVHQRNGNYIKALYYYNQLSNLLIDPSTTLSKNLIRSNFIQSNIGLLGIPTSSLNKHNDLFISANINSLLIISYLIENQKLNSKDISEFDINYNQNMSNLKNLLNLKEYFIKNINSFLDSITNPNSNSKSNLTLITLNSIAFFCISSNSESLESMNLQLDALENDSPFISSLLYLILGYSYINNPGLSELDNLNLKVSYFNSACRCSLLALDNERVNNIAKLGYTEIWKIMNHNKNLYQQSDIDKVYQKIEYLQSSDHIENHSNANKKVKFV